MTLRTILENPSLRGHFTAQFFGNFNDNFFKQIVMFYAARKLFPGEDRQGVAMMVFTIPFILCSGYAGQLSEQRSKQNIVVKMKIAEIFITILAAYALYLESWVLMLTTLFILGLQSTINSPPKYAILPELVPANQLLETNSIIATLSFAAILLGQATAGPSFDIWSTKPWMMGIVCFTFAIIGTLGSLQIKKLPPLAPETTVYLNPFQGLSEAYREMNRDPRILRIVTLYALGWFNASVMVLAITGMGAPSYLNIPQGETWRLSLLLIGLTLSIVIGCLLVPGVSKYLRPNIMISVGIGGAVTIEGIFVLICTFVPDHSAYWISFSCMLALGFTGALFFVPFQTFLQHLPAAGSRGKVLAFNNVLSFVAMFLSGLIYEIGNRLELNPGVTLLFSGFIFVLGLYLYRSSLSTITLPQQTNSDSSHKGDNNSPKLS